MSNKTIWVTHAILMALAAVFMYAAALLAGAATTDDLAKESRAVLEKLYSSNATAAVLGRNARAVLVFPRLIRAGLMARPYTAFSGAYGEGTLFKGDNQAAGFYKLVSSTWRPDGEDTTVSCVVFLMTDAAEGAVRTGNWSIDPGAIADSTKMNKVSIHSTDRDAYVFAFDQHGVINAKSLQGSTVSQIAN